MYFGADYYPEHWPRERWDVDAKLMKEAGFNLIRVAEFSWAKLEPSEGHWDFSWLDEALDVFYNKYGIQVVMGTPTETPPKWLMDKFPEIYRRDENDLKFGFGSRRHYCYNSEVYREYTEKIVEKMARHYANHPAVAAWQVDNEFGDHKTLYCYCESCRQKFIVWLKKKYGSLDALNKAWGTVFWSQTYTDWDQIIVPKRSQAGKPGNNGHNPALNLDYSRFQSDAIADYCALQCRIIRRWSKAPITHNVVSELYDYYKLGEQIDIATYDNYPYLRMTPHPDLSERIYNPAFQVDQLRGVKHKNVWIMEEESGPCGWNALSSTPRPGEIREWSYQAMAHGAEAMVYFRWRACLFGTEQYWYGILDHDGVPRRRYEEVKALGKDFPKLCAYNVNSKVCADALLVRSFEQQWTHTFQEHNLKFDYRKYLKGLYRGFYANNYNLDVSSEETDFSGYKLVVAPAFNLMDERLKEKFEKYVAGGGNLVVTFRSGTKEMDNSMTERTLPGYFKEVAGIELEEFDSLNTRTVSVEGAFGKGTASIWADIIKPVTAKPVATYVNQYYAGKPAITVNEFGKGRCYYVGCDLDDAGTEQLLDYIAKECGVKPALENVPDGVEVVRKESGDGREFWFVMNFSGKEQTVDFPCEIKSIETDEALGHSVKLPVWGCAAVAKV